MFLFESLKSFMMKETFDFDDPDITLLSFHPQLYTCYMINGIFFQNKEARIRFVLPILNTVLAFIATAFEAMFIWRGLSINDYAFASESCCYIMILGTVPIVYPSILRSRDIILDQLNKMNDDFLYITKLSADYRKRFLDGQVLIWQLCWMWFAFIGFISLLFIMNTLLLLLYQSLIAKQDENIIRPLIFPLWLPADDPYRTPNYEAFMLYEIVLIGIIYQNFGAYVYMQFHFLLHYYNLMDLIIMDLKVLFEGLDESVVSLPVDDPRRVSTQLTLNRRIKRIVSWHQAVFKAVDTVSSVFGPPLVYQVSLSSVVICIMAYQVADQLEHGKIDFLFATLWFGACVQLWIPCYLGTLIRNKAFSVGDACWNSGWQETSLSRLVRVDMVIFILRAQQPLTIQFTALPSLTLEAFSSIMSTSYSYFNMLRQSTKS